MPPTATVHAKVVNRLGLHARPAMMFVDVAAMFTSAVRVTRDDLVVDGKSIMEVMMLAASQGSELVIAAEGPDADAAVKKLKELVDSGFDEE